MIEVSGMSNDRISRLCEYIDKNKAKNYPIYNNVLNMETDYIKNSYFKMLAVILQQGQEIYDSQRALFERQVEGVECDYQVTDYFRQALEIEVAEYVDFTNECREREIRYRFIFDAMLLSAIEKYNDEQIKLVASFAESLKIKKDELKYMALLAKSILEQSTFAYVTAEENKAFSVPASVTEEYVELMFNGPVYKNDNTTIIHAATLAVVDTEVLKAIEQSKTPVIKLSNIQLSLEQYRLSFEGFEEVILENCVFENGFMYAIHFEQCKKVKVLSCKFRNFNARTIIMDKVQQIVFENTAFENCIKKYSRGTNDWEALGGVIYSNFPSDIKNTKFVNCVFENCGGRNTENYYSTQFISNCKSVLDGCMFNNCWNYNRNNYNDPENEKRCMFPPDSYALNCSSVNSANIV